MLGVPAPPPPEESDLSDNTFISSNPAKELLILFALEAIPLNFFSFYLANKLNPNQAEVIAFIYPSNVYAKLTNF